MFNEMYQSNSEIRKQYNHINSWLKNMSSQIISQKNEEAEVHVCVLACLRVYVFVCLVHMPLCISVCALGYGDERCI